MISNTNHFQIVKNVLMNIKNTPSHLIKKQTIKENIHIPFFEDTVTYAYHPLLQFNLLSVPGNYINDKQESDILKIFDYLKYLSSKRGITDIEKDTLDSFIHDDITLDLVNCILNKDLKCGVGYKIFSEFFDLPNIEPALCEDNINTFWKNINGDATRAYWSIKLDGVRTRAYCYKNNTITYISRTGKSFNNFHIFDNEILQICKTIKSKYENISYPIILDGEVISKDKDFQKQMTMLHRLENVDANIFRYEIFDICINNIQFEDRYNLLEDCIINNNNNIVNLLPHYRLNQNENIEYLLHLLEKVTDEGEEGLVIKDGKSLYKQGYSFNWVKLKKFTTIDLQIIGIEEGTNKYQGKLGSLIVRKFITDKNNKLSKITYVDIGVGSGFTDKEREEFWLNPPIGKIAEIKYQNETKDKSLRFPVFVRLREDKEIDL